MLQGVYKPHGRRLYPQKRVYCFDYVRLEKVKVMEVMKKVTLIESLNDLESIWGEFVPLAKELGFDYVIYTISNNNSDGFYYYDNFGLHPKNDENFYDPFLDFCCHSYDTMFTGPEFLETHKNLNMPPEAYGLIERGTQLGMISGLAIPLRLMGSNRYGGFNLGSGLKRGEFEALCDNIKGAAQVVCMLVHRHIESVLDQQRILMEKTDVNMEATSVKSNKLDALTPRENDILSKIANGYSRQKCADALHLSESTISTHMKNIYRKLGVHNRVQATNIILQQQC